MALVPGLLAMAGDGLALPILRRLADGLDPIRWPGLLLIAGSAATRLPTLARASDRAAIRARPERVDVALSLGASRRRAIRLGGGRGPGKGVLALSFALAATSVAPALVLAPSMRTRPVGPALRDPGRGPPPGRGPGTRLGDAQPPRPGRRAADPVRAGGRLAPGLSHGQELTHELAYVLLTRHVHLIKITRPEIRATADVGGARAPAVRQGDAGRSPDRRDGPRMSGRRRGPSSEDGPSTPMDRRNAWIV